MLLNLEHLRSTLQNGMVINQYDKHWINAFALYNEERALFKERPLSVRCGRCYPKVLNYFLKRQMSTPC